MFELVDQCLANQTNTLGRVLASCLCHSGRTHRPRCCLVAATGALEYPMTFSRNGNKLYFTNQIRQYNQYTCEYMNFKRKKQKLQFQNSYIIQHEIPKTNELSSLGHLTYPQPIKDHAADAISTEDCECDKEKTGFC